MSEKPNVRRIILITFIKTNWLAVQPAVVLVGMTVPMSTATLFLVVAVKAQVNAVSIN